MYHPFSIHLSVDSREIRAPLRRNTGSGQIPYVVSLSPSPKRQLTGELLKDWTFLSASSVFNATASAGRDGLINMAHSRAFLQSGETPNPATYSPIDGAQPAGAASPAMGAIFSFLALKCVRFFTFWNKH